MSKKQVATNLKQHLLGNDEEKDIEEASLREQYQAELECSSIDSQIDNSKKNSSIHRETITTHEKYYDIDDVVRVKNKEIELNVRNNGDNNYSQLYDDKKEKKVASAAAASASAPASGRKKKDSCLKKYFCDFKEMITNILVFYYNYLIKYPILYIVGSSHGQEREERRRQGYMIWLYLILVIIYGISQVFRSHSWQVGETNIHLDIYLIIARASGKLVTVTFLIAMILMIRPLTSAINEIPQHKRHYIGWKRMHIDMMFLCILFSMTHSIAHVFRIINTSKFMKTYEIYFGITGIIIWLGILSQAIVYLYFNYLEKLLCCCFKNTGGGDEGGDINCLSYCCKLWFRKTHIHFYLPFTILYLSHASQFWHLLVFCIWYYFYKQYKIEFKDVYMCCEDNTNNMKRQVILIFKVEHKLPGDFGYYCQVKADGICSSYTMISLQGNTDSYIMFRIDKCILTDRIIKIMQNQRANTLHVEETQDLKSLPKKYNLHNKKFLKLTKYDSYGFKLFGPYHSTDMTIKENQAKRLIILCGGIGTTVAESVIWYHYVRKGYWNAIIVIQNCGGYRKDKLCKKNIYGSQPLENEDKIETEEELFGSLYDNDLNDVLSLQLYGNLDYKFIHKLFSNNNSHYQYFEQTHYLVCGRRWHPVIEEAKIKSPFIDGKIRTRIHFEEFAI